MFFALNSAQQLRPTKRTYWALASLALPLLCLALHALTWLSLGAAHFLVLLHLLVSSFVLSAATMQYLGVMIKRLPWHLHQPARLVAVIVCIVALVFAASLLVYQSLPVRVDQVFSRLK